MSELVTLLYRLQSHYLDVMRDCKLFIDEYVYIEDRDAAGLAIRFTLWARQQDVLDVFLRDRLVIVLKARQLGLTWLALAYATWQIAFKPGFSVVALSQKEDDAKELVRRLVFILRNLPTWIIRHKSDAQQVYTRIRPVWDSTTLSVVVTHPNGEPSTFNAMASAPGAGRSLTASLVLIDEWAFQQFAREIWSSAYPTINRPTGGQVIGLSTAKRGTLFEEKWDEAVNGLNGFTPVFLPWNSDPRRTQEWYESTKKQLKDSYHAEYPATAEEAFLWSANSVFDIECVLARINALKGAQVIIGSIECDYNDAGDPIKGTQRFVANDNGFVKIYEHPKPYTPYVIGCDTAEGGLDYSAAHVIDNITGRQVAVWRGHCDTDLFAKEMFNLGHYYNYATIAVEVNFDLHPVKELQRLGYTNQYRRETIDSISRQKQRKYGWRTTAATRGPMIGNLVAIVRDDIALINDAATLGEMLTFVRNEDGRPEAQHGKHDDLVMSLAIAYKARDQQKMTLALPPGVEFPDTWTSSEREAVLSNIEFAKEYEKLKALIVG